MSIIITGYNTTFGFHAILANYTLTMRQNFHVTKNEKVTKTITHGKLILKSFYRMFFS